MKPLFAMRVATATRARQGLETALTIAFALALLWPAAFNGGALLFHDSEGYVSQGAVGWETVARLAAPGSGSGSGLGEGAVADDGGSFSVRSLAYSMAAWPVVKLAGGPWGLAVAHAAVSAALVAGFLGRGLSLQARGLVFAGMATLTPLPIFVSYAMPDIFAGLLVVAALVAVRRNAAMGWIEAAALAAVGGFAAATHLSHLPLAAAVGIAGMGALAWLRLLRAPAATALLTPAFLAAGVNLLGSAVAFDEPSVVPQRPLVVLARALADGPARRHVEAACANDPETYSLCAIIDRLPRESGAILFGPRGFRTLPGADRADRAERLREEEVVILKHALRAEPFAQVWAVVSNTQRQLVTFGLDDLGWSRLDVAADGDWDADLGLNRDREAWRALEAVHAATVLASLLGLAVFAARDRFGAAADERALVAVTLVAILANAAICGGLSAPADRYGARMVWLAPLLAAFLGARRVGGRMSSAEGVS